MDKEYDVIVIGTGNAGTTAALAAAGGGKKTAIIDDRPYGGTCALRGCVPKKILTGIGEIRDIQANLSNKGIFKKTDIDWQNLIAFKDEFTDGVSKKKEEHFKQNNIDTYHGKASFYDEKTLVVGEEKLTSEKFFIAAGAMPRKLGIPGEDHLITSDEFLDLEELPKDIIFVGGGYISFEFAHVAAQVGASPLILHRSDHPLKQFDRQLVQVLVEAGKTKRVQLKTGEEVTAIVKQDDKLRIKTEKDNEYFADLAVHGAGRVPAIAGLNLKRGNVEHTAKGISVDRFFQSTTNSRVYAAGDAADSGKPLSPVATKETEIAAHNMLKGNSAQMDYGGIPSVVFTQPPLAKVGINVDNINNRYKVIYKDRKDWYSTKRLNGKCAASKVILDKKSDMILGAHILGKRAEEIINMFALAMRNKLTVKDLKAMVYSYPSVCSDIPYLLEP